MPTYPNEIWPGDAVIQALDGTTDSATGLPYIPKGTSPSSTPTYEIQYNRRLHRLNQILGTWRQGMVVDEGDLNIGAYPMEYTLGGVRRSFAGYTGRVIPDDTTKLVYLNTTGSMVVADSWPSDLTSYLPLAVVTASDGSLSIQDLRPRAAYHVPSLEKSGFQDRRVVSAHCQSVVSSASDIELFAFDPREDLTVEEIQVYCRAVSSTATVDIKAGGSTLLSSPVTPSAGSIVKATLSTATIADHENITVHATTDGSGSIGDLSVTLMMKATPSA